jgi:Tol biopolymer transport system component/DNA-binding winged helix-turn-helix (wHTH) protein
LETGERILLREGHDVSLTPKLFDTLLVLVESGGRILDKEDLLKKVWPDTFVEEASLAKKVSILRKVLGEDAGHHYIETIPRRGYRFVAEVREVWEESRMQTLASGQNGAAKPHKPEHEEHESSMAATTLLPDPANHSAPIRRRAFASRSARAGGFLALVLLTSLLVWGIVWRFGFGTASKASKLSLPALNAVPLTSFQGRETQAAFSPDGSQIAFVWDGSQGGNQDIYVKLIDAETPLRLTTNAAADIRPVWSPDGRYIVFQRQSAEGSAFYLIPALGGAERKLADVFPSQVPSDGNSQYFSPDGKFLAIPDKGLATEPLGIFKLSIESGEKRRLTSPSQGAIGDHYPAFSPDGKMLAFVRETHWSIDDLYVVSLAGGEPRRLTFEGLPMIGLAWTSDSSEILFTSRRGGSTRHLWRVAVTGGAPERVETIGNDVLSPALSLQGNRLAYTQTLDDINIWRIELDAAGRAKSQTELIASTFWDHGPDYSPDGRKIVFASGRSGSSGIWVCESDGSKARLLHACGPHVSGTPRWSPDGRWIVFDSRSCAADIAGNPDVYLISADGGQPRRLTTDEAEDVVPTWSHDGQWIYFASNRSGSMQVWKTPIAGGAAVQVTQQGGFENYESPDGKYLYYTKGRSTPGIWRIQAAGGAEELVLDQQKAGQWRYWRVVDQGIYFATATTTGPMIEFFNFATKRIAEVTRPAKGPERNLPGLAVSPDGRSILYTQVDRSGSDLMMVENFR